MKTWKELTVHERRFHGELAYNKEIVHRAQFAFTTHKDASLVLPWLEVFDNDDQAEFLVDYCVAIQKAEDHYCLDPVNEHLRAWKATAEVLADPVSRDILLGKSKYREYIEISRPGDIDRVQPYDLPTPRRDTNTSLGSY